MSEIAYTVTAAFADEGTAADYVRWLLGGHVAAVVARGAESGLIVRVEDPAEPIRVEVRYRFPDREAFDRYAAEHAPALRAEGVRRFGDKGVSFQRSTGSVVGRYGV